MTQDEEETLRSVISYCIDLFGNKEATRRIIQYIKDQNESVYKNAQFEILEKQLIQNIDNAIDKQLDDWDTLGTGTDDDLQGLL